MASAAVDTVVDTDNASTVATDEDILSRSREVKWYNKDLSDIPKQVQVVLEQYSKIPADQVHDHIYNLREKAWEVHPFPCLGGFRFLDLMLYGMPQYDEILSRIRSGEKFLDLGCCFGQELRRLIFDGAPSENLYGSDLRPEFLELGYDLFHDRESCKSTFIAADVFAESSELMDLNGTISILYAGSFFHLFGWPEQLHLAKLVTRLLRPQAGSMLLGRQVGSTNPGTYQHKTNGGGRMFRHDEQTWKTLWDEAGKEMGVKWSVESELLDVFRTRDNGLADETVRQLRFCVRRLE